LSNVSHLHFIEAPENKDEWCTRKDDAQENGVDPAKAHAQHTNCKPSQLNISALFALKTFFIENDGCAIDCQNHNEEYI
jgi:hypothetical protein